VFSFITDVVSARKICLTEIYAFFLHTAYIISSYFHKEITCFGTYLLEYISMPKLENKHYCAEVDGYSFVVVSKEVTEKKITTRQDTQIT
jgi:hypothetical protein